MLDYSRRRRSEARKAGLDPAEQAYADLLALGWSDVDAFLALGRYRPALSDDYNRGQVEQLSADDGVRAELERMRRRLRGGVEADGSGRLRKAAPEDAPAGGGSPLSVEEIMQEIQDTALKLPEDDKDRGNLLAKLLDLRRKNAAGDEEDATVHYYLPLSCSRCSLHQAAEEGRVKVVPRKGG